MKKTKKKKTIKKSYKKVIRKKTTKVKKYKVKVSKTKISPKVLKMLKDYKVKYELVPHKTVFTAYDLAQTLKMKPKQIVKTLVLKMDKNYALVLLPGDLKLDIQKLKKLAKVKKIEIISEKIMEKVFKVKPGAITPFGCLYKVPVYLENQLARVPECLFQSGSFNESIKMKVKDFIKLENPIKGVFGKRG